MSTWVIVRVGICPWSTSDDVALLRVRLESISSWRRHAGVCKWPHPSSLAPHQHLVLLLLQLFSVTTHKFISSVKIGLTFYGFSVVVYWWARRCVKTAIITAFRQQLLRPEARKRLLSLTGQFAD